MSDIVLTQEQTIDKVLDAYATKASLPYIAMQTGLKISEVREILEDPKLVRRALRRRVNDFMLWWAGAAFDAIQEVFEDGTPTQKLQAIRATEGLLEKLPIYEDNPKTLPRGIESAVAQANEVGKD